MAIDFKVLWNFNDPELSERRFGQVLSTANPDDAYTEKRKAVSRKRE